MTAVARPILVGLAFAALACHGAGSESAPAAVRVPVPSATVAETATSMPSATPVASAQPALRKRQRTINHSLPVPTTPGPPHLTAMHVENPRDAAGRLVFIAADDSCFVQVPGPDAGPPVRIAVDCPPELDDQSWNQCVEGTLYFFKIRGECWCKPFVPFSYGSHPTIAINPCPRRLLPPIPSASAVLSGNSCVPDSPTSCRLYAF